MQLHLLTWPQIDDYLKRSTTIVIPIGSTEQHGPTGFLGTDALCPEIIVRRAESNGAPFLIGPTFNVGSAQHHLGFSGTITYRPSTMIAAMKDWTQSLMRHGFTHFFWLNGHGGNVPVLQSAFAEIYADRSLQNTPDGHPTLRQTYKNWWELSGVMAECRRHFPSGDGMHATASEVAVTYAGYPDHIPQGVELTPKLAPIGPIHDADDYRSRFPDGRIGSDPSQATVDAGNAIINSASRSLISEVASFESAV